MKISPAIGRIRGGLPNRSLCVYAVYVDCVLSLPNNFPKECGHQANRHAMQFWRNLFRKDNVRRFGSAKSAVRVLKRRGQWLDCLHQEFPS